VGHKTAQGEPGLPNETRRAKTRPTTQRPMIRIDNHPAQTASSKGLGRRQVKTRRAHSTVAQLSIHPWDARPPKHPMLSERVKRQIVEKKLFRVDGLSQDADAAGLQGESASG